MPKKQKKFADDSWAIWVDGAESCTAYINDWINPTGKSYVDLAIRVRGVKSSKTLHAYIPFAVSKEEIEDVSLSFADRKILHAVFSASCLVDYKKNERTSEIAYNGKTVDIVHISTFEYQTKAISEGTLINIDLEELNPFLDNDEVYFVWRMPHKSLDEIFKQRVDVGNTFGKFVDLLTTPVLSERYGYSIRVNESRLLPAEITKISGFHRRKLEKAVINLYVDESYEITDPDCYLIRRLEEELYREYIPAGYSCEDVIMYQWKRKRRDNLHGQFNFYYNITRNSVSRGSMILYLILLPAIDVLGNFCADGVYALIDLFK